MNQIKIPEVSYEGHEVKEGHSTITFHPTYLHIQGEFIIRQVDEKYNLPKDFYFDFEQSIFKNHISEICFGYTNAIDMYDVTILTGEDKETTITFESREKAKEVYDKIMKWKLEV